MTVTLRSALAADAPVLAAILQRWRDATPWMPDQHDMRQTTGFLGQMIEQQSVMVADPKVGLPVGFLARDEAWITALYVKAASRRRGVGAALIEATQDTQSPLHLWTFQANRGARAFYARHGFVEGRRTPGDNAEGLPDVQMSWTAEEERAVQ